MKVTKREHVLVCGSSFLFLVHVFTDVTVEAMLTIKFCIIFLF